VKDRKVAIVGAALSDCGRVDDKSAWQLHHQATSRALAEASISRDEVDGFASHGTGNLAPIEVAEYLGLASHVDYIDSTGVGGSCWEIFLDHAAAAIARGHVDTVVLSYGSTARADLKRRQRTANLNFGNRGPLQFEAPFGHTLIAKHAMAARRHMHEFGTTIEQLAEIAVSARHNASFNPDAYYRDPMTIDDVQSSEMVADPFTKLHCCIRSDGGGAIVLTHEDRARDCATEPVWVLGTGEAISHATMSEWVDFTESPCVRSGRAAFEQAGCKPEDIDVVEVYDSFTLTVLLTLEGLGFCKKGEGGPFVEDGRLRIGGALPTNTDGGGLSSCQPGMRGIFLLVEAVKQLRGECGERQVPDARLACVSATGGWISSTGTAILGRD
jgi:acetyl-CoA acetyltransferase